MATIVYKVWGYGNLTLGSLSLSPPFAIECLIGGSHGHTQVQNADSNPLMYT